MKRKENGGVIGSSNIPNIVSAAGIWSLRTAQMSKQSSVWPSIGDAFAPNNSLLLLGETETDSSLNNFTITKVGNAATSTTQVKYGSRSWAFDGTGDYLSIPANAAFNFGSGDLTIEAWVYIAGNSTASALNARNALIFGMLSGTTVSIEFTILGNGTTTGTGLNIYTPAGSVSAASTISQGTWNHLAVSRSGTSFRFFVNGSQIGSTGTSSISLGNSTHTAYVGGWPLSSYNYYLNGYIDELRVTKGVARYTANFTPPGTFA